MFPEYQLPIQEFTGVEFRKTPEGEFEAALIERLRVPTRFVAEWYKEVDPPNGWYKGVLSDTENFNTPEGRALLRARYEQQALNNPHLRDRDSAIVKGWRARPMITLPAVKRVVEELSGLIMPVAEWTAQNTPTPYYQDFAGYLQATAELLPVGEFDEIMARFTRLSTQCRVLFMAVPAEYQDDPLGTRRSPQGLLAYADRKLTEEANLDLDRYGQAALQKYGYLPKKANVFVANFIMATGFLGVEGKKYVGFNLPNNDFDEEDGTDNNVICLFPNRMGQKNKQKLSPKLEGLVGITSSDKDIANLAVAHEYAHGYRPTGEVKRLAGIRSHIKEGWANEMAIVLSTANFFPSGHPESVVRGALGFASDDLGPLDSIVFEPYGKNQPTLDTILQEGAYTLDAYLLFRQAFLERAVRHPLGVVDYDKIIRQAEERDTLFREIAIGGTEDSARKRLEELIDHRRFWLGTGRILGRFKAHHLSPSTS